MRKCRICGRPVRKDKQVLYISYCSEICQMLAFQRKKGKYIEEIIDDFKLKEGAKKSVTKIVKEKGLCPICFSAYANSKHHILPISKGGKDSKRNIVRLCRRCHNLVEEYADKDIYYSPHLAQLIRLML